jgi:hypothetical protein
VMQLTSPVVTSGRPYFFLQFAVNNNRIANIMIKGNRIAFFASLMNIYTLVNDFIEILTLFFKICYAMIAFFNCFGFGFYQNYLPVHAFRSIHFSPQK